MISKERLEELIEQGATVWHNDWEEIKLDKNTCEVCECRSMSGEHITWYLCFPYEYDNRKYWEEIDTQELEENVDKGKWELEFGCIERTERLELPTWEEIKKDFIDRHREYGEYTVVEQHDIIIDIQVMGKCIYIAIYGDEHCRWKLTKENYTLVCRKAKELFLGEKDVKD